jgi:hypothetical protein
MQARLRALRRGFRRWLDCRRRRCTYYTHYLAYGPADLTHVGFHSAELLATEHFDACHYQGRFTEFGKLDLCPTCSAWERRLRA